jgi:hypothetical protein
VRLWQEIIESYGDNITADRVHEAVQRYKPPKQILDVVQERPALKPGKIRSDNYEGVSWGNKRSFRNQMESAIEAVQAMKGIQVPSKDRTKSWSADTRDDHLRHMSSMLSELQDILTHLCAIQRLLATTAEVTNPPVDAEPCPR